jgi:hypothetical protein
VALKKNVREITLAPFQNDNNLPVAGARRPLDAQGIS